ncbi:Carboxypeptidase [Quillaja saponaria]|uniref:Carboxypeptidase n=1 Tax=Quillaja saponaria TaxID=32244 RepID=A0AAD7LZB3_QUISA|nr:Carboxypeptidase [Quillaja saponaria]
MGRVSFLSSSSISISICFVAYLQVMVVINGDTINLTQPSFRPINHDLYHSSGGLMEEIKGLVHRHPNKLTVETINTGNKGYGAEITVVTYCRQRGERDERSRFRILLSFGQHGRELITT